MAGFDALRVTSNVEEDDLQPTTIELGTTQTRNIDPATGAESIETPDGSVVINFNPQKAAPDGSTDFYENLAEKIDSNEMMRIAEELLQGIEADNQSRQQWLQTRARGIDLLGLKLQQPRSEVGSAPLEGMSTVSHPLLLEATLRFQSTARGELLPSGGPVKVRDDDDQGGNLERDEMAEAMEIDLNHYLTVTAPEYYPDTDRMLFAVGFGGCGFKKVYTCPIRRRPVSESVDAKDLIVSDTVTDLRNAGRVTQRIQMRKSVLKRMQLVGAYRDVKLHLVAAPTEQNVVDRKMSEVQGVMPSKRPEDRDQELFECYCELDIKGYEHKDKGKITGLPLPYRVVIDKDTREILEIRRNWAVEDDQCLALAVFVKYPFVAALGFYDIGLVHILGNATIALTAAWREMLDAGMFASFPGGLMARQVARQETNEFRVAPGSFVPIETGGQPISETVMPLPYKDVSSGLLGLTESITQLAERVGGTAELAVGEGSQEAPVGTTLAMIEQATKVLDAVHKRIHAAQAEEFQLLKREFKKDPASLWRTNRRSRVKAFLGITEDDPDKIDPEKVARLTAALNDNDIVPAADPNTPSEMHRLMKATALIQLMAMSQQLPEGRLDPRRVIEHAMKTIRVGGDMFAPPPDPNAPPPPDPKVQAAMIQAQASKDRLQIAQIQSGDKARETATKAHIAEIDLQRDVIGHQSTQVQAQADVQSAQAQGFAAGGAVDETPARYHEVGMAQHEADMAVRGLHKAVLDHAAAAHERQDKERMAAREHASKDRLAKADILKQMIAQKTKELEIEKAKVDAKKPKPKPKGSQK